MKVNKDTETMRVCGCCEHSIVMKVTDTVLCKRKNKLKVVAECNTCRHFSLDLLKLEPLPRKIYTPDINSSPLK